MVTTEITGTFMTLILFIIGLAAAFSAGYYTRKAREAMRLVDDMRLASLRTPVVTGETLLAMDRNNKARQERLRQTLPRPPDVRQDMFGPRRKP